MRTNNRLALAQTYLSEVRQKWQEGTLGLKLWVAVGLAHAIALILFDIAESLHDIKEIFREGQNG